MKKNTSYKRYKKRKGIPWLSFGIILILALALGSKMPDTDIPGSDQVTGMSDENAADSDLLPDLSDEDDVSPAEITGSMAESSLEAEQASGNTDEDFPGADQTAAVPMDAPPFSAGDIPSYSGLPSVIINDNKPYFSENEQSTAAFEYYSKLDDLGRCGTVCANIGQELMPSQKRGSIGNVRPSGWHTIKYSDLIEDKYLYNRCHLLAYALTGENDNVCNLITGTRYMNVEGMLPYEEQVIGYINRTGNHVLMRVTPIFDGTDLVARGVLMEACSREDRGQGICFNIFCYNVQPGIVIDYADGSSQAASDAVPIYGTESSEASQNTASDNNEITYVLNTRSMKFHKPSCKSVNDMKASNRRDSTLSRDEMIAQGYSPCGACNP